MNICILITLLLMLITHSAHTKNPTLMFPDELYAIMHNQAMAASLAQAFLSTTTTLQQQQPVTHQQAHYYLATQQHKSLFSKLKEIHGNFSLLIRNTSPSRAMLCEHKNQKEAIAAISNYFTHLRTSVADFEKQQALLDTGRRRDRERTAHQGFKPRRSRSTELFASISARARS